jgi:mannose-6-phosphate isomerase
LDKLACTIMGYAWGSRSAISSLQGRPPSSKPEAELWMGAHPVAPSIVERDGARISLADVIARSPEDELGAETAKTYGARLPFLLKVLAAAEPLSLQAHPTMDRARAGFADEDARGIPRDAPNRNYRDASHKPELLCAITPFEALSCFRKKSDTLRLFDALAVAAVEPVLAPLRTHGDLGATFRAIMTLADPKPIVEEVVLACAKHTGEFAREASWATKLAALYPGDVGIVSALFLNLIELAPGEAIYLGAGNLHAYLEGVGVEIMASSDNVLRGGLTKKHVDVPELMAVLDFTDGPVTPLKAKALDAHEEVYETPAPEFRLSRIRVNGKVAREARAPEILLAVDGEMSAGGLPIAKGEVLFVPGTTGPYDIDGRGALYRATTNGV